MLSNDKKQELLGIVIACLIAGCYASFIDKVLGASSHWWSLTLLPVFVVAIMFGLWISCKIIPDSSTETTDLDNNPSEDSTQK